MTPLTRAIYVNSPNNPTGGVLTRGDLEQLAGLARERDLWVISDEAYEDVLFDEAEQVSIASLPDMYDRTLSLFTFSKSFAMTGLRLGYLVARSDALRARIQKLLFLTASNVSSIIQYGGIGGLEAPPEVIESFRTELKARREFFYQGVEHLSGVFSGLPPKGAFYAFLRINPAWQAAPASDRTAEATGESLSWRMAEHLIRRGRIGCVPGVDFGRHGEGYIRFCFARERRELAGALEAMKRIFGQDGRLRTEG